MSQIIFGILTFWVIKRLILSTFIILINSESCIFVHNEAFEIFNVDFVPKRILFTRLMHIIIIRTRSFYYHYLRTYNNSNYHNKVELSF